MPILLIYRNFKAFESGADNNGAYIKHLKKYLTKTGMTIQEIFKETNFSKLLTALKFKYELNPPCDLT